MSGLAKKVHALLDEADLKPLAERIPFVLAAEVEEDVRREALLILENLTQRNASSISSHDARGSSSTAYQTFGSLVGRRFGDFIFESEVGRGGMGVVYRAMQVGLSRAVAVKVMDPRCVPSTLDRERFLRESVTAARLVHENIVPVFATGETDGVLWYAMQLIDGCSLRLLIEGKCDPSMQRRFADMRLRLNWVRQIADALAFCHERGILHRDVKPENILVGREDLIPRLADFGLAKVEGLDPLSKEGDFGGTLSYMSSEQLRTGLRGLDGQSDVYSLGVVLYEVISGQKPFEHSLPTEMLRAIDTKRRLHLRQLVPDVAPALVTIVEKALEPLLENRYATAADLRDDLARFLDGKSIMARPPGFARRAEAFVEHHLVFVSILLTVFATLSAVWVGVSLSRGSVVLERPALARPSNPLPAWIRIELPPEGGSHRVAWARRNPDAPGWLSVRDFFTTKDSAVSVSLEAGEYAITVVDDRGRFAEERVMLAEGERDVLLRPRLLANERIHEGMKRFEGGNTSLLIAGAKSDGTGDRELTSTATYVAPFWIDVAPVTVGDYRRFLTEQGKDAPASWEAHSSWMKAWRAPPRVDFESLPIVGLSWLEAVEYARWVGKRLPMAAEWQLLTDGVSKEEWDTIRADPGSFGLRAPTVKVGQESLSEFFHNAMSVSTSRAWGPMGLVDPFGNVRQWLDDPMLPMRAGGLPLRRAHGGCWLDSPDEVVRHRRTMPTFFAFTPPSTGFRCAKSADPRAIPSQ